MLRIAPPVQGRCYDRSQDVANSIQYVALASLLGVHSNGDTESISDACHLG